MMDGQNTTVEEDEVLKESLCYVLKDSLNLMLGTELVWAVSTVIFRFIMVKYADRGLVSNGGLSELFNQLYICLSTFLTLFIYAITLLNNFKEGPEPLFVSICLNHNSSAKTYSIGVALCSLGIIFVGLMFWSSETFLKSKSKNGRTPPAIIGRFQRNFVTFKETAYYHSLLYLSIMLTIILETMYNTIVYSILPLSLSFMFICYIFVNSLLIPYLHPSNTRVVPHNQKFYIREPQLLPRRDHLVEPNPILAPNINIHLVPIPRIIDVQPVNIKF